MKSKEKENLKNMSVNELKVQGRDLEKQLFQIKFKRTSAPLENPLQIRTARRKAAIIKTLLRAKETALPKTAAEVKK
jgi:ribosomal protein L29